MRVVQRIIDRHNDGKWKKAIGSPSSPIKMPSLFVDYSCVLSVVYGHPTSIDGSGVCQVCSLLYRTQ